MPVRTFSTILFSLILLAIPVAEVLTGTSFAQGEPKKDIVLKASEITPKIFPENVFYRGKVGAVQMRNTGGVHFPDDFYVLAGLVDTTGYASDLKEKYQGYFLNEVPVEINGQSLKPGGYGIGFVAGSKFIVSDVGGNTLMEITGRHDAELKRAVPLQVLAAPEAGVYRLYIGRNFVILKRSH